MKCELFHDNFQNYKRYGIPKAQLVIADIPFKPVYFKQGEQMTIFDFLEEKNGMHTRKDIRCQK